VPLFGILGPSEAEILGRTCALVHFCEVLNELLIYVRVVNNPMAMRNKSRIRARMLLKFDLSFATRPSFVTSFPPRMRAMSAGLSTRCRSAQIDTKADSSSC
jgi:hypothetical protein